MFARKYRNIFVNLRSAALATATALFIFYLVLFLGICYAFTWMPTEDTYIKTFERYVILTKGIYMLIPFGVSAVLIFFLITENFLRLLVWIKVYLGLTIVYFLFFFAAGLYSSLQGSLFVGIPIAIVTLILTGLNAHCLLMAYFLYAEALEHENLDEPTRISGTLKE